MARELLLLGCLALLWGSSYLLIGLAVQTMGPVSVIAARVAIASLVLLGVVWFLGHRLPTDRATWGALIVQSFLNSYGAWTLLAWGQQYVETGLAGVLNSTAPVFVVLLAAALGRPSTRLAITGAITGLVGVIVIMGPEVLGGIGQQIGAQAAVLAGAVLYAIAALNAWRFAHLPPAVTAAGTMLVATVILVPAALILEQPLSAPISAVSLFAAVGLGVFSTAVALLLYFRLVQTLGPLGVASQAYLRAGVAVALGALILNEVPSLPTALGMALAIAGVVLINWPARQPTRPEPPGPDRAQAPLAPLPPAATTPKLRHRAPKATDHPTTRAPRRPDPSRPNSLPRSIHCAGTGPDRSA